MRFVVPFAPGGSSEIVARARRRRADQDPRPERLRRQQARRAPATSRWPEVARADDQHTIILGHIGTLAVNPYIFAKLPYDPNKDFKPVTLLAKVPSLYVVHPDLPAKDLKEFIALPRASRAQLNYGSAGNGSAGHLAMEYLKMATNIFITHVPYRGTGPQLTDLLAGRLDAASVGAPAMLQFIKAGKLRCIATGIGPAPAAAARRAHGRRAGLPGLRDDAVVRPAGAGSMAAGRHRQARRRGAARRCKEPALARAAERRTPRSRSAARRPNSPAFIATEQARWKPVIARAKIKPD